MRNRWTSVLVTMFAAFCLATSTLIATQTRQVKKMVQPTYPQAALQMRVAGTVKLEAVVDRDGNVSNVIVVSGNALLKPNAIECVKQWKYEPSNDLTLVPVDVVFRLPE